MINNILIMVYIYGRKHLSYALLVVGLMSSIGLGLRSRNLGLFQVC